MQLTLTTMAFLALFSVVLLVYCTGVCASQESDLVVLTTASRLREEIKSQLDETLARSLPNFTCNCDSQNNDNTTQVRVLPDPDLANTVEELKECVINIKSVTDLLLSHLSLLLTPGSTPSHPATSCKEILQLAPQSPSGLYWIRGIDNAAKHMYCDMERSCKGVAGGWMRVASIDMTDTSSTCPSGLRTLTSPRRLCAMNTDSPGCSSAVLPVQGVQYSQVCGKIIGYQHNTPDAFYAYNHGGQTTIGSRYVDGSASLMEQVLANTFGHLLQHFMSITLTPLTSVPVLTPATLHLLQYLTL